MPSNPELKLMTKLLNLDGMKVKDYQFLDQIGICLYVENETKEIVCPKCGKKTNKIHQNHYSAVRDLPLMEQPVYLQINRRRMRCSHCGNIFREDLNFLPRKRRYTKRFRQQVCQEAWEGSISKTAKKYQVSEQEIETMLQDLGREFIAEQPERVKRLGIDEIAVVKGQKNYYAVFVDLDTGHLPGLCEKRTEEEITKYLKSWGDEVLSQIEEVSIDLWNPYKKVVNKLMPQASIVADRFHVMKQVNQELDRARKECQTHLKKRRIRLKIDKENQQLKTVNILY